jgi:NTE family protein
MKIGLALGSGSARGWSHIGIINALSAAGITPDIVCGTSIGALVGASSVQGNLARLEEWVRSLTRLDVARLLDISISLEGFVDTGRLHSFLNQYVANDHALIDDLERTFAAVATDMESGREIWLSRGSLIEAVWSSISLPGLFPPTRKDGKWLVDGGLVNPVPVSVCRALGADIVIAVNLNGDIVGKHFHKRKKADKTEPGASGKFGNAMRQYASAVFKSNNNGEQPPNVIDSLACSVNITQDRITRSRMAGDPPDIFISPRLSHIGLLEFYRADEAIAEGERCVQKVLPDVERILETMQES